MDPNPENNRAAWYQGPMKLEVVKSCGATETEEVEEVLQGSKLNAKWTCLVTIQGLSGVITKL